MRRVDARALTLSAALLGVMLILGWVESLFPISNLPGIKLGLSNGVLLIALQWLGVGPSILLMAMKVVLGGFLYGSVSAMMYSFAGGALSLLAMALLTRGLRVSLVTAGAAGGVFHNVGQVALSMLILKTDALLYYMAILMAVGAALGAATGTVALLLGKHLKPPTAERSQHAKDGGGGGEK